MLGIYVPKTLYPYTSGQTLNANYSKVHVMVNRRFCQVRARLASVYCVYDGSVYKIQSTGGQTRVPGTTMQDSNAMRYSDVRENATRNAKKTVIKIWKLA